MKKCNRCNSFIDWDKPFCPLCGSGEVIDVPKPERAEPILNAAPAPAEDIGPPQAAPLIEPPSPPAPQLPPAPVAAVPPAPPISGSAMVPPIPSPIPQAAPPPPVPSAAADFQSSLPPIPDVPDFTQDSAMPPVGSISQIHNTPDPTASFESTFSTLSGMISQIHQSPAPASPPVWQETPSSETDQSEDPSDVLEPEQQWEIPAPQTDSPFDPFGALLRQEKASALDVDAEQFGDPLDAGEPEIEDPIEALLKSGPQFNADDSEIKDDVPLFASIDGANEEPFQFPPPAPRVPDKNVITSLPDDVKPNQDDNDTQDDFLRMFPGAKG